MLRDKFRERFKKHQVLYLPCQIIYHRLLMPIVNGYFIYMIYFFLFIRRQEIKKLEQNGFSDICIFKPRTWRIGKERDHAYRRYYIGTRNENKCFIKIAENDSTIENEIYISEKIQHKNWSFVPAIEFFDRAFLDKRKLLATHLIPNLHPIAINNNNPVQPIAEKELLQYCEEFKVILDRLKQEQLVHADIHKGNLMLDANNHLILMDFGISKFLLESNNVDYKSRPGTFYKEKDDIRIYDDAYSFICMINGYAHIDNIKSNDAYQYILKQIGKVQFQVKL